MKKARRRSGPFSFVPAVIVTGYTLHQARLIDGYKESAASWKRRPSAVPRAVESFRYRRCKALGVTRQALSELANERAGMSVEMAIRLSKAFGSSPETWLGMQMAYDLWMARGRAAEIKVQSFKAA
ncbi:MAG TPA: HigA family addiction module antitoxin [Candidatus Binataceae bacterium]|nr:HigA family addiction module antitoxin [Candidatus Binataceae bacterium]